MSDVSSLPGGTQVEGAVPPRGLLWSLTGSQLALSIVFGAVPSVLMALQVEDLVGDDRKAGVLAILTTIGAIAASISQLTVGLLSDRTRSRQGSRTPWIVLGAAATAPLMWGMGFSHSVVMLGLLYVLSEIAIGCAQGPLVAVLPDRVPSATRGRYSAALGMGSCWARCSVRASPECWRTTSRSPTSSSDRCRSC